MMYAQINTTTGEVISFPYNSIMVNPIYRMAALVNDVANLPIDAVLVDFTSAYPKNINWDQTASVTNVVQSGTTYVANFELVDKFTNDEDKLEGIKQILQFYSIENSSIFKQKIAQLSSSYLGEESNSWPIQIQEAQAYQANTATTTILLSAIAQARGITVSDLANRIITNYTSYNINYGMLLGTYQKNIGIFNSVDVANSSTWDNINSYIRL